MSTCRSCNQPIVWVATEATETKKSRAMPVDAAVVDGQIRAAKFDDGNIIFTGQRDGRDTPIVRYVKKGPNLYRSHFASCSQAASHRRR